MDPVPPLSRRIFILGRDAVMDVDPVARQVLAEGAQLVLVSVGYPVAARQTAIVSNALGLADRLRLWLDVVLVTSREEIAGLVQADDRVTIVADGRERRWIERALGQSISRDGQSRAPLAPKPARDSRRQRRRSRGDAVRTPVAVGVVAARIAADQEEPMSNDGEMPEGSIPPAIVEASESVEALAGREVVQPVLDTVWTKEQARAEKAAQLRIYLGAAPGVGKTYAMLDEGQRRKSRGTDVVVGTVQTYERPRTIEILQGLEAVPSRKLEYRGTTFEEMDSEALIERRPEVALIDELAHTNIPGSRRAKRWEDVLDVLAQGITVITTLNVQHLASVNDVVAEVTGIRQQETVPDWLLDLADDIELVDMSPRALQRRMIHGNVYPDPRKSELALQRFFTIDNLTALRELALMRVANRVDETLLAGWSKRRSPETRERILVCVSRPDLSEELIRRGGRIAQRTGGDLFVVHVVGEEGRPDPEWLQRVDRLAEELGGEFQLLEADDPVESVLSYAYSQHVTQILVGESLRSRWQELVRGSFVNRLIRRASNIDVHVIARRER
jgi:nucleotide-binding universal stress UspA family protein